MGKCAKAKAGEWCGGIVLGYDLVPIGGAGGEKCKKTKLIINEKEAETAKIIFEETVN
jgi:site-specific DNA recombinase